MQVPQCAWRSREGRAFRPAWWRCCRGRYHDAGGRLHHCPLGARVVCMDRRGALSSRHHPAPPVLRAHHYWPAAVPIRKTGAVCVSTFIWVYLFDLFLFIEFLSVSWIRKGKRVVAMRACCPLLPVWIQLLHYWNIHSERNYMYACIYIYIYANLILV